MKHKLFHCNVNESAYFCNFVTNILSVTCLFKAGVQIRGTGKSRGTVHQFQFTYPFLPYIPLLPLVLKPNSTTDWKSKLKSRIKQLHSKNHTDICPNTITIKILFKMDALVSHRSIFRRGPKAASCNLRWCHLQWISPMTDHTSFEILVLSRPYQSIQQNDSQL